MDKGEYEHFSMEELMRITNNIGDTPEGIIYRTIKEEDSKIDILNTIEHTLVPAGPIVLD